MLLFWLICWAVFGVICALIAPSRGRQPWQGFLLGVALGFIGVIIIALMRPAPYQPPERAYVRPPRPDRLLPNDRHFTWSGDDQA